MFRSNVIFVADIGISVKSAEYRNERYSDALEQTWKVQLRADMIFIYCSLKKAVSPNSPALYSNIKFIFYYKSYCSTVHFRRITSIYQPKNAHIISYKTLLKHFKTLRHVSILSDQHQGALFLARVILPKPYVHLCSFPYALHALPLSFFSICSPEQH